MTHTDGLEEEINILRADAATMLSEIERLTTALTKANADRDRLAQQLAGCLAKGVQLADPSQIKMNVSSEIVDDENFYWETMVPYMQRRAEAALKAEVDRINRELGGDETKP